MVIPLKTINYQHSPYNILIIFKINVGRSLLIRKQEEKIIEIVVKIWANYGDRLNKGLLRNC